MRMLDVVRPCGLIARPLTLLLGITCGACLMLAAPAALAKEAEWIWSPAYEKELAPEGTCYFRKTFKLGTPEQRRRSRSPATTATSCTSTAATSATAQNWKLLDVYDITKYLVQGHNTVAVKAVNTEARLGRPGGAGRRQAARQHARRAFDRRHLEDGAQGISAMAEGPLQRRAMAGRPQLRRAGRHAALGQRSHAWPAPRAASRSRPSSTSNGSSTPRKPAR